MDFARREIDSELVFAEDYLDTEESPYGFCCPYSECAIKLMLKSYKSENKVPPYFAAQHKGKSHTEECPISKQNKSRTTTTNGINTSLPLPYKNKLIFGNEASPQSSGKNLIFDRGEENKLKNKELFHNRTAKHIAPIVRWYLQNPHKGNMELKVPDCRYRSYESIFQRIYLSPEKEYKGTHIFFGSLYFDNAFKEQDNKIIFNIYQSNYHEPMKLIVDTHNWKKSAKSFVKNSTLKALEKKREAYKNQIKNVYPYIFFLGDADKLSGRVFHCNRHAAIYVVTIESLYLRPKNDGIYVSPQVPVREKSFYDVVSNNVEDYFEDDDLPIVQSNPPREKVNTKKLEAEKNQEPFKFPLVEEDRNTIFNKNYLKSQNYNEEKPRHKIKRKKKRNLSEKVKYFFKSLFVRLSSKLARGLKKCVRLFKN